VRLRQAHRHVEVVRTTGRGAVEDRHHEARVDRVHHVGDAVLLDQRTHRPRVGGVDLGGLEPGVRRRCLLRADEVVVGDHDRLEEVTSGRDRSERAAHTACADEQDPHACPPLVEPGWSLVEPVETITHRCRTSRA
jgi:hypothetical protein